MSPVEPCVIPRVLSNWVRYVQRRCPDRSSQRHAETCGGLRVQVVTELNRARMELETEGRATQLGKLCATPFGVDIVGITEFIALIGALVGGAPRPRVLPPPCH